MNTNAPRNLPLTIAIALLALTFAITGFGKIAGMPPSPENFTRWGLPPSVMIAVGTLELLCGIALLIPRVSPLANLVLIALMLGALRTGIVFREALHIVLPLALLAALSWVAYVRRERLPFGARKQTAL